MANELALILPLTKEVLAITSFFFALIFSFIFVFDRDDRTLKTFSVFTISSIAFISNDFTNYLVTIFIVATIITKLEFLENLAAIVRNSKEYFDYQKTKIPQIEKDRKLREEILEEEILDEEILDEGTEREILNEGTEREILNEGTEREILNEGTEREILNEGTEREILKEDTEKNIPKKDTEKNIPKKDTEKNIPKKDTEKDISNKDNEKNILNKDKDKFIETPIINTLQPKEKYDYLNPINQNRIIDSEKKRKFLFQNELLKPKDDYSFNRDRHGFTNHFIDIDNMQALDFAKIVESLTFDYLEKFFRNNIEKNIRLRSPMNRRIDLDGLIKHKHCDEIIEIKALRKGIVSRLFAERITRQAIDQMSAYTSITNKYVTMTIVIVVPEKLSETRIHSFRKYIVNMIAPTENLIDVKFLTFSDIGLNVKDNS